MERNRRAGAASGSGVVLAVGRRRGRNPSDEEDRMGETSELRFGKRPKKDMNGLSASASSLIKRKRWGITQDTQPFGTHEPLEVVKAEDVAPLLQKDVKSRVQSKEDKFFMDFSAVPRKRRSSVLSSSKLTSTTKRQQDVCFTQQQSPAMMSNGSSSLHGSFSHNRKRRLKPSGTELQIMKVSEFAAVSDQEAEVAEALFVLASSKPAVVMNPKLEAKLDTEAKCTFSATHEHFAVVSSSSVPDFARAGSKGKQHHVDADKEEAKSHVGGVVCAASSPSELVHSSVGETELESTFPQRHSLAGEVNGCQLETSLSKIPAVSPQCVQSWPCHIKETVPGDFKAQFKDHDRAKHLKQETHINAKSEERRAEVCLVKRTSTAAQTNIKDGLGNNDKALTNSSRSDSILDCDGCISKLKRDLLAPPITCKFGALHENVGELYSPVLVKEDSVKGLKLKGRGDGGTQGLKQQTEEQKEQTVSERVRRLLDREGDHSSKPSPYRKVNDTGNSSVSSCFSSLSSTAVSRHAPMGLAGWTSGFSHLGYDGSTTTSCAATSSASIDKKAAQLAMQRPHAAISSPVPKMKSCATHVYVAHYIHREQLATRHSLWSAALCRATTYNLNIPPVKPLDDERPREQKSQTHQTDSSFVNNIPQSSMQRMASGGSAHGSNVAVSRSASHLTTTSRAPSEASMVTASGHAMAAHAQYLQALMQQSGVASFPHLFNGPPGQPHLISHLQPSTQQAANVVPVQKQQQTKGAPSSQMEHQKGCQSPFQTQQQSQNLVETSASESSAHVKRESKDLSLMAPSGGGHVGKFQQISACLSSKQQQHLSSQNSLSSSRHQVKGPIFGASMTPSECHEVHCGSHNREQYQSSHEVVSVNDFAFTMKVQGYSEDRRVTMKEGADPFDLPKAVAEPCSQPLCGSSACSNEPAVNGTGLSLPSAVCASGAQSCESAASLGHEQGSFLASQKISSMREATTRRHDTCSSTSVAPSTPPRVCSSDSSASHNTLEALSVWSSPPSVSKVAPSSALESPSDQKSPLLQAVSLHSQTVEAQHTQQAGQAQQCLDPDAQFFHTGQEVLQGVCSPMLAADDGLHSSSLDFTSGTTVSETPTNLKEYRKPLQGGGIQQVSAVTSSSLHSQTTVASS